MKIKEIVKSLEQLAPPVYQESYDNSGLLTGSGNEEVKGILVTLDCVEDIVDEAINTGCNLIVAHHPLIFGGLKRLNGKNYVERTVIKAIKNDIAIYAIHTNLDNMNNGVSAKICSLLGLENLKILAPKKDTLFKLTSYVPIEATQKVLEALGNAGAGQIGNYSNCSYQTKGIGSFLGNSNTNPSVGQANQLEEVEENKIEVQFPIHLKGSVLNALHSSHPYEEVAYHITKLENVNTTVGSGMYGTYTEGIPADIFLSKLKDTFKVGAIRHTKVVNKTIKKVAVCGGAGSFLLGNAKGVKADVFITGDFKYHEFFDAEDQIMIADIGHYESEQFTSELLIDYIKEQFDEIKVIKTSNNTNPVHYFY
ncbi:Nif3-like dinuclear metal center hexameric protein [Flammeovirga yaeyamensis]|uniref:GTP cyclohydrolase 1 type 2 homolog n=1 Tax=Flammeovirga yaeyamensis TaxID=367791 RepID=A0AAX1N2G8_9BACT|nr:Nif3-like dinuclear metal center hexameric protein [Flammeovirga yaeyamensis]MBB3696369.1 dinuclear metal center YbgI/SA1388 family protein [Flammeovirga yaeyamensis]NMF35048.1 Nif3-like dinuclear metal center hexameric protein [Flammeovirga yaeyamensis]QWG00128.1 Nif3-like dinuclear metal center hexameric protein [Flammeovirga yaeyamensis]